ncbi:MAG: SusC/RagA family TonB-linked outer membrane protein [Prolixibacteraceae bacterium]|jgi:TonB-linked SusC/RagA family outer membrane protein|nr:SusC/RagA family TonB-linked outer membrane protein [Prolixibacteraceae bacterium]
MNNKNIIRFIFLWLLVFLAIFDGLAQNKVLKGKITDVNGNPVTNAIISVVNNPDEVSSSDQDGNFMINGQPGQYLKITVADLYQKTVKVENETMAISLTANDELISLGYGILHPKEEMTMAFGTVKSNELSRSSAVLSANALYGKIAGLSVLQNGGIPGSDDPTLLMRASGTTRSNNLLILVDGFERPLSYFALSEIESVVLLKDAPSLALYGLRGANGVLLVTTKMNNGQTQKPQIKIGYETGITKPFRKPVFYDAFGYAKAYNEALTNDGLPAQYSQSDLDNYKSGISPYFYPNVNWSDEAFRNFGRRDNFNISFSGSNKSLKYYTLLDYLNDDGLLKPVGLNDGYSTQIKYNRLNLRTNLEINMTATTKLKVRIGGTLIDNNQPTESASNIVNAIYAIPSSAFPVRTYNGAWGGTSTYGNNPVALIAAKGYSVYRTRGVMADIRVEQKLDFLLKGLTLEAAYSNDNFINRRDSKTQNFAYSQIGLARDPSTGTVIDTVETKYGQKTNLAFSTGINNLRKGSTILGKLDYKKVWGNNTISSALFYQQEELVLLGRYNTYLHQLMATNIHYSNSGKYFADLSVAYTGTNLLTKSYRFGFFPAASLAWNLSKEDWFNDRVINNLKIRASYGIAGNDQVPQDMDISLNPNATGYYFGANNTALGGWSEGKLAPGNLSFEKSYKSSLGLDAKLFKKLDISLDAYYDIRKDILTTSIGTISNIVGLATAYKMGGIVTNKGIDAELGFRDNNGDFGYYFTGRFSYGKSKIKEMSEEYKPYDYLKRTGESVGQAFGLEAVGFFRDASDIAASPVQQFGEVGPGDVKYKDQNNDDIIDEFDEIPLGHSTLFPEIYYSGSVGIVYKGIGFDAVFQGIGNYSVYANTRHVFWPTYGNANITTFSDNRWTPQTVATATLPRISTNQSLNNYRPNSIWIMDGSYMKLRSLELYYELPKSLISRFKVGNVRIYLRGMDLFSIDHIDVVDPENIGINYPTLASYHLGIKLGL